MTDMTKSLLRFPWLVIPVWDERWYVQLLFYLKCSFV